MPRAEATTRATTAHRLWECVPQAQPRAVTTGGESGPREVVLQGIRCGTPRQGPPDGREVSLNPRLAVRRILHALEHAIAWVELGDDPPRYLVAGADRAGDMLELVVMTLEGDALVIHAMTLRRSTERELFGREDS